MPFFVVLLFSCKKENVADVKKISVPATPTSSIRAGSHYKIQPVLTKDQFNRVVHLMKKRAPQAQIDALVEKYDRQNANEAKKRKIQYKKSSFLRINGEEGYNEDDYIDYDETEEGDAWINLEASLGMVAVPELNAYGYKYLYTYYAGAPFGVRQVNVDIDIPFYLTAIRKVAPWGDTIDVFYAENVENDEGHMIIYGSAIGEITDVDFHSYWVLDQSLTSDGEYCQFTGNATEKRTKTVSDDGYYEFHAGFNSQVVQVGGTVGGSHTVSYNLNVVNSYSKNDAQMYAYFENTGPFDAYYKPDIGFASNWTCISYGDQTE